MSFHDHQLFISNHTPHGHDERIFCLFFYDLNINKKTLKTPTSIMSAMTFQLCSTSFQEITLVSRCKIENQLAGE
jgi:hypothetical protein